jgi:hypothetical protein
MVPVEDGETDSVDKPSWLVSTGLLSVPEINEPRLRATSGHVYCDD